MLIFNKLNDMADFKTRSSVYEKVKQDTQWVSVKSIAGRRIRRVEETRIQTNICKIHDSRRTLERSKHQKNTEKTTEKQLQSVIISRDYVHFTTAYNFNTRELITASQKVASDKFPCHPQDVTAGGNSNQLLAKQQLATLSHRHNARIHIVAANKSVLSVSVNASC